MEQQRIDPEIEDLIGSRQAPEASAQPPAKRPRGRPRVFEENEEDRMKVRLWARVGTPQEVIAHELGMCVETMLKLYGEEFEHALEKGVGEVAATLYAKAIMGDNTAMIFYLKTKGRWKEARNGDEDAPIHIKANVDVAAIAQQMRQARVINQPMIGDSSEETGS